MQPRSQRPRGTLANVLIVLVLAFGLLLVSAGSSLVQIRLNNHQDASEGSLRLAEATANLMIARLLKDPALDENSNLDGSRKEIRLELSSYPGGEGYVTLNSARARQLDIPWSVNNLTKPARQGWNDTPVAGETAHIVAEGRYRGEVSRVEVVLYLPKFPYVVSSTVPISGTGLEVFGVRDPSVLDQGIDAVRPEDREPGHVATNAFNDNALGLHGSTKIQGDAQSRGGIGLDDGAVVTGEIRPNADKAPVPDIDIASLDPTRRAGAVVDSLSNNLGPTTLSGFKKTVGNLRVSGPLTLDGGFVYVEGSVEITGGLSGNGAIIATGGVRVTGGGGSSFTGAGGSAIIAGDSVHLESTGGGVADFRGLVYTEKSLTSRNINIAGSVAVNNPSGTGLTELTDVTMVESPELGVVGIPVTTTLPGTPQGMMATGTTFHANVDGSGRYGFPTPVTQTVDDGSGRTANVFLTANMNGPNPDYNNPPPIFEVTHPPTSQEPYFQIAMPASRPADLITYGSIRINNLNPAGPCQTMEGDVGWQSYHEDYTDRAGARSGLLAAAQAWQVDIDVDGFLDDSEDDVWNRQMPEFVEMFNYNAKLLADPETPTIPGTAPVVIPSFVELDLSRFYNLSDRVKILSWRQL